MFCRKCGKSIADNSKFCVYCGEKVAEVATETVQQSQPAQTASYGTQYVQTAPVYPVSAKKTPVWIPIVIVSVVLAVAIIFLSAFFIFAQIGKAELEEQLLRDWTNVEKGSSGAYYTLKLDFSEEDIKYSFESQYINRTIATYDYEILSKDTIKIENRDKEYTIEFNDAKTMMTITPALTSSDAKEYWFNFD